ncbi:DUF6300 family protein [Streptomyces sp. NPDC088387]|uniref:DUF6300 family protein n=1 Tax=Streptomyces sp. NPDC088387 TaxID=3365859 RepID=UPI00382760ED
MTGISRRAVCPSCRAPAVLSVTRPHTWHNRAGTPVHGVRESLLCGTCDPAGRRVLAAHCPQEWAALVLNWLATTGDRLPDPVNLAAEEASWRAGEL